VQRNHYHISHHASQRMAQRNLSPGDVELVLRYGRVEYRTGAAFYFLARRDIPEGLERQLERLIGTTLVTDGEELLTVYRNRKALRMIRHKRKQRARLTNLATDISPLIPNMQAMR